MNAVIHLLRSPEALAYQLEAAGAIALARAGALLEDRISQPDPAVA
jgi:hypothetical protein